MDREKAYTVWYAPPDGGPAETIGEFKRRVDYQNPGSRAQRIQEAGDELISKDIAGRIAININRVEEVVRRCRLYQIVESE